jgi:hypothetical protein
MDDDVLRRGKPTVHVQFGEAGALLAGDALQTLAYALLTPEDGSVAPALQGRLCGLLARASGCAGMAGGQAIDLGGIVAVVVGFCRVWGLASCHGASLSVEGGRYHRPGNRLPGRARGCLLGFTAGPCPCRLEPWSTTYLIFRIDPRHGGTPVPAEI